MLNIRRGFFSPVSFPIDFRTLFHCCLKYTLLPVCGRSDRFTWTRTNLQSVYLLPVPKMEGVKDFFGRLIIYNLSRLFSIFRHLSGRKTYVIFFYLFFFKGFLGFYLMVDVSSLYLAKFSLILKVAIIYNYPYLIVQRFIVTSIKLLYLI